MVGEGQAAGAGVSAVCKGARARQIGSEVLRRICAESPTIASGSGGRGGPPAPGVSYVCPMSAPVPAPTADYLDLSYRPDLRVLTVRWLRAVTFAELQLGFRAAAAEAEAHQAALWLVDVRRRTELDAASSGWVALELLPDAAARLAPATLRVAYLLSPMRAQELRRDAGLREASAASRAPERPYQLATFIDEGPAVRWLLAQS